MVDSAPEGTFDDAESVLTLAGHTYGVIAVDALATYKKFLDDQKLTEEKYKDAIELFIDFVHNCVDVQMKALLTPDEQQQS